MIPLNLCYVIPFGEVLGPKAPPVFKTHDTRNFQIGTYDTPISQTRLTPYSVSIED